VSLPPLPMPVPVKECKNSPHAEHHKKRNHSPKEVLTQFALVAFSRLVDIDCDAVEVDDDAKDERNTDSSVDKVSNQVSKLFKRTRRGERQGGQEEYRDESRFFHVVSQEAASRCRR